MNEAFFFGPGDDKLFANYHPPVRGNGQVLTIICPPLFSEYMVTHLALRDLAISLADKGQHVVRFDYRGTGDSFGDLDDVTISDWVEDIALAVREGIDLSGTSIVRLLGVRAGALLACRLGTLNKVQRLVLWDPVPDGAQYLQELRRIQVEIFDRNLDLNPVERRETVHEYSGHRLSKRMLKELLLLDASTYANVPMTKLHVVSTSSEACFPLPDVSRELVPFACKWETDLDQVMMPKSVLERLAACLTKS